MLDSWAAVLQLVKQAVINDGRDAGLHPGFSCPRAEVGYVLSLTHFGHHTKLCKGGGLHLKCVCEWVECGVSCQCALRNLKVVNSDKFSPLIDDSDPMIVL